MLCMICLNKNVEINISSDIFARSHCAYIFSNELGDSGHDRKCITKTFLFDYEKDDVSNFKSNCFNNWQKTCIWIVIVEVQRIIKKALKDNELILYFKPKDEFLHFVWIIKMRILSYTLTHLRLF